MHTCMHVITNNHHQYLWIIIIYHHHQASVAIIITDHCQPSLLVITNHYWPSLIHGYHHQAPSVFTNHWHMVASDHQIISSRCPMPRLKVLQKRCTLGKLRAGALVLLVMFHSFISSMLLQVVAISEEWFEWPAFSCTVACATPSVCCYKWRMTSCQM